MILPFMLLYAGLGGSAFIPQPYSLYLYIASMVFLFGWVGFIGKFAGPLASRWHWINFRPTSKGPPNGWTWRGSFNLRWKDHPKTTAWLPEFIRPDGSGKGAYLTPFIPDKPKTKHPFYNRKGKLKVLFLLHPYPFDNQFSVGSGKVVYIGAPARVSTYSWCVAHEIMPEKRYFAGEEANTTKGVLNHVPYVDLDLYHNPWFYIQVSSGTRAIQESQRQRATVEELARRPVVAALAQGGQTLLCLDCGTELPHAKDGRITCTKCNSSWPAEDIAQ